MNFRKTLIVTLILLSGCSSQTNFFIGNILSINEDTLSINCTELLNKGENADDYGIDCNIFITEDTQLFDENGESISVDYLSEGESVKVNLEDKIDVNHAQREGIAKQIIKVEE
ncbi:hypothetical protein ACFSTA_01705 [Ornithinibacillus salinisoli]|uniref:DUF3221 domain-containing protein n=1 Tax=Ornithinibacillus salinisoli TaxID=1848459 RepID=A0ABW4VXK2_9BACI